MLGIERREQMKFRMRLNDAFTGKQVKQKTFKAEDWDEADKIAHRIWREFEEDTGRAVSMGLSVVK